MSSPKIGPEIGVKDSLLLYEVNATHHNGPGLELQSKFTGSGLGIQNIIALFLHTSVLPTFSEHLKVKSIPIEEFLH